VEWLKANAHPIRTLSVADRDFRDLEPLRLAIGNARVVMLGEQSHGDGTTFHAKARLIAFLHQEMGFDVLAWESGLYDVHRVWNQVLAGEDVIAASRQGIFGVWTSSEQALPTFDYVASTLRTTMPLELAGFDHQFTGTLARDSVAAHVEAFAKRIGSSVTNDAEWPSALITLKSVAVIGPLPSKPSAADQLHLLRILGNLHRDATARGNGDREALFWTQGLVSIASNAKKLWAAESDRPSTDDANTRDRQMAENLVWLAREYYPNRKIIVWAASSHVARSVQALRSPSGTMPYASGWTVHMGTEVYRELGSQMYSIGFTAAKGSHGRRGNPEQHIGPLVPGSLEDLFSQTSHTYAFLNFRNRSPGGEWLNDVSTRAFGYQDLRGDWANVFDAIIFTRDMVPSTVASR
jgi:erythromycin esterase